MGRVSLPLAAVKANGPKQKCDFAVQQLRAPSCYGFRRDVVSTQCERGRLNLCSFYARCETPKKTTMEKKKKLHSYSQNHLFLINKLLISNKRQKISKKLEANFNTNTSKTTTCVSHLIYCASLTNKACARGGGGRWEKFGHTHCHSATAPPRSHEKKTEKRPQLPNVSDVESSITNMKEKNERRFK